MRPTDKPTEQSATLDSPAKHQKEQFKKNSIAKKMKDTKFSKRKTKLRKAWYRCQARAKHLAADLHWKTIKHILDRYDVVVIGKIGVEQDESYTSQACFRCGHLKKDLGAAKTYHCRECGLVIDRDVNSGYNIMVRCASEHHAAESTVLGKRKF